MLPVRTPKGDNQPQSEIETKNHRKRDSQDEKPAKNGTFFHFGATEIEAENERVVKTTESRVPRLGIFLVSIRFIFLQAQKGTKTLVPSGQSINPQCFSKPRDRFETKIKLRFLKQAIHYLTTVME